MKHVGFSLINNKNIEVQSWYENYGNAPMPYFVVLPNGDILNSPNLYETYSGGFKIVKRFLINNPPSKWFDHISSDIEYNGTDIVETYIFSEKPNVVPNQVSCLQFRKALNELNIRTQIEDFIKTLDNNSKDEWTFSPEIKRYDNIINKIANNLEKNNEEMDDIFRLASTF